MHEKSSQLQALKLGAYVVLMKMMKLITNVML